MRSQKKITSRILKCGINRVWLDPARISEISDAITAIDIRNLIKKKLIKSLPKKGISSFRRKKLAKQKLKGRRKGYGSRKGKATTRSPRKKTWIKNIRSMRKEISRLKDSDSITHDIYKDMYKKTKGGFFRNKSHMISYLERNKMMKVDENAEKKKTEEN